MVSILEDKKTELRSLRLAKPQRAKLSSVQERKFEEYKAAYAYPRKGDILISAAGTIGRTVIFNGEDAYYQDSNIVWIANDETLF